MGDEVDSDSFHLFWHYFVKFTLKLTLIKDRSFAPTWNTHSYAQLASDIVYRQ